MKASTKVVAIASVLVVLFLALVSPAQTVGTADPLVPFPRAPIPTTARLRMRAQLMLSWIAGSIRRLKDWPRKG